MTLDSTILQKLAVRADVNDYVRIVARAHAGTPLGMGYGKTASQARGISSGCSTLHRTQ